MAKWIFGGGCARARAEKKKFSKKAEIIKMGVALSP